LLTLAWLLAAVSFFLRPTIPAAMLFCAGLVGLFCGWSI
jgi:hypothetical protein